MEFFENKSLNMSQVYEMQSKKSKKIDPPYYTCTYFILYLHVHTYNEKTRIYFCGISSITGYTAPIPIYIFIYRLYPAHRISSKHLHNEKGRQEGGIEWHTHTPAKTSIKYILYIYVPINSPS